MTRKSPRRGVTLIEILCVIVLLAVVTTVLAVLINHTLEAQRIQGDSYERLQQSKAFADQFRIDIARAKKAPVQWRQYVAGPDTLILQTKQDAVVIYTKNEGTLTRIAVENEEELERSVPLPEGTQIEFVQSETVIRARLTPMRHGKALAGQSLEIAAALAGDWR